MTSVKRKGNKKNCPWGRYFLLIRALQWVTLYLRAKRYSNVCCSLTSCAFRSRSGGSRPGQNTRVTITGDENGTRFPGSSIPNGHHEPSRKAPRSLVLFSLSHTQITDSKIHSSRPRPRKPWLRFRHCEPRRTLGRFRNQSTVGGHSSEDEDRFAEDEDEAGEAGIRAIIVEL